LFLANLLLFTSEPGTSAIKHLLGIPPHLFSSENHSVA
jgi:hypothetical protein